MKYSASTPFKDLHDKIFQRVLLAMTGPGRQKVAEEFDGNLKLIRQNWEGYHLLKFANTIRPIREDKNERNRLDGLLVNNGIGGFEELQSLPSSKKSAFTQEKSDGVFKSLAEFQDIPLLVCFLNFLEFCRNSQPPRPLKVFNGKDVLFVGTGNGKIPVTLDYAIDDIKKHIKNEEERLKKEKLEDELSRKGIKQPSPVQPRLTIPLAKQNNTNYYANAVLEVIGRDKEKAHLKAFLDCDLKVAWFQLAGVAGQGKSRLAFDLIEDAEKLSWHAGFLRENDIEFFKDHWKDWQPDKPHLLVFDYVIGREQAIKPILQTLIYNQVEFQHSIRILLVERQRWDQGSVIKTYDQHAQDELGLSAHIGDKAEWFLKLCEKEDFEGDYLKSCRFKDGVEELKGLDHDDLVTIVKQLTIRLSGETLTLSDDSLKETLVRTDDSGRPLYAYLLAQQLSESQEGYRSWTKFDLLNYQLVRDKRRWEKAFEEEDKKAPTWGDSHPAMKLAVLATIVRELKFQDDPIQQHFDNIDSSLGREAVAITSGYVINNDNRPHKIHALEPDLLGEWFVLYCFHHGLEFKELLDIAWHYSPDKTADFLQRITQDFIDLPKQDHHENLTEKLIAHTPPHETHYQALANVAVAIAYKLYQRNLTIPKNIIVALDHAANSSDDDAMNYLGYFYHQGIGVTKNPEKAFNLYQQAVWKNNSDAMFNLAVCYARSEGVKQDWNEAINLYRLAANKGNSNAMVNLGACYEKGEGVQQDRNEAAKLYQQAVEKGNSSAMVNLSFFYQKGIGVQQDWNKAIDLYQEAVEKGNSDAMANLGLLYQRGEGVKQNWDEAVKLYQQAVKLGNSRAMAHLGVCYEKGEGVKQDWNIAADLYRQAIEAGEKKAIGSLENILMLQNFLSKGNHETKGWSNNKSLYLATVPAFDPPILAGGWEQLPAKEVIACLDKVIASFETSGLIESLDGYLGQYARLLPLNFYKDCNLVDIQLYNPSNENILIFSAILSAEHALLLEGTSAIIHNLNRHLLSLDSEKSIINYLQFFCSYIQANHQPFQIVSNLNEIPFAKEISQSVLDKIQASFLSPRYVEGSFEREGWQQFEACVLYGDVLFAIVFRVFPNGAVSMEDDNCILDKLPILQRQYNGVFRTPLRSLND